MGSQLSVTAPTVNQSTNHGTRATKNRNNTLPMKKLAKKLVGFITLVPYTFLGLLFIDFLIYPQELLAEVYLNHVYVGTLLWIVSLLVFYLIHLFRIKRLDTERQILWAIVLLFGNVLAMPVYWYRYIWHQSHQPKIIKNEDGTQIIGF